MLDSPREYVNYILSGIRDGFRIGYARSGEKGQLSGARKNMHSADENHQVVTGYLEAEMRWSGARPLPPS